VDTEKMVGAALDEVRAVAEESVQSLADMLLAATATLHAADLLGQWQGFDGFRRAKLGADAATLTVAFGLRDADPTADVMACHARTLANDQAVGEWTIFLQEAVGETVRTGFMTRSAFNLNVLATPASALHLRGHGSWGTCVRTFLKAMPLLCLTKCWAQTSLLPKAFSYQIRRPH
jgi:hypothetical protein